LYPFRNSFICTLMCSTIRRGCGRTRRDGLGSLRKSS
jgi:hypothetical protein